MKNKMVYLVAVIILVILAYKLGTNATSNNPIVNKTPNEAGLCTRTSPYDSPPELLRAMELSGARDVGATNAPKPPKGSFKNCIHLIYKSHDEMNGAEGYFTFDNTSNANDLRIYVDDTYKNYDDILTASLLTHELRHVTFFVKTLEGASAPTCVNNEAAAFYSQLIFLTNLNQEEWKSITYRVSRNPNLNSAYQITNYLLRLNGSADQVCPNAPDQTCWNNYVLSDLKTWVSSNPYYQKECSLK